MFVYKTLKSQVDGSNFKIKFDNCLYVLPHMLKRRRHNQRFLNLDSGLGPMFEGLLREVVKRSKGSGMPRPTAKRADRANAIIELLRFEASESTIQMVMEDG